MRYENLKIAMNLSIIIAISGHFVAEVIAPHQDGVIMLIYEQKFPEIDVMMMVNVRSIAEMGAYVHLLEYNNIEGMILLSGKGLKPMTTSSRPLLIPRCLRTSVWMRRPRRFWWKTSIESRESLSGPRRFLSGST